MKGWVNIPSSFQVTVPFIEARHWKFRKRWKGRERNGEKRNCSLRSATRKYQISLRKGDRGLKGNSGNVQGVKNPYAFCKSSRRRGAPGRVDEKGARPEARRTGEK